ncbi:MAG TPA: MarR family winged helix-turn-helix transcriptional regulator [Flavobacterium sp.]|nr:MarR family winged helix-turn-helix transcriptional regulator [Flavobacterium sp.]HRZ74230.1 MarR family winged helix-turn-helix transcriptional regulator [Flavobacterium sp.]
MEKRYIDFREIGKLKKEFFRVLLHIAKEKTNIHLTVEQLGLLYLMHIKDFDVIQKQLAVYTGKNKSTILRITDSLEEKGLVRKAEDKNDRRKNYLMITKTGQTTIEVYLKIMDEIVDDLQKGINETDLKVFSKVIDHIKVRVANYEV